MLELMTARSKYLSPVVVLVFVVFIVLVLRLDINIRTEHCYDFKTASIFIINMNGVSLLHKRIVDTHRSTK